MTLAPPAEVGMSIDMVDTPALLIELDPFERNLARMAALAASLGMALRPHAKTHKSPDIAHRQIALGAVGQCCQKVSEAEVLVAGGVSDILVSNEVVGDRKLDRLAALARDSRVAVCADDRANVEALDAAAARADTTLEVLVEIDVGGGRCGVRSSQDAVALAQAIDAAGQLRFGGLQAYHGTAQHIRAHSDRRAAIVGAAEQVRSARAALAGAGLDCARITGAGTGSFSFEAETSEWDELQCGSYVFMDADYAKNRDADDAAFTTFEHSLFVLATVMSRPEPAVAVVDAGHKAAAIDSGNPVPAGLADIAYTGASDEHGALRVGRAAAALALGDKIRLIPGHCDPTVNLHDWYVCVRNDVVEAVWPVAARGGMF